MTAMTAATLDTLSARAVPPRARGVRARRSARAGTGCGSRRRWRARASTSRSCGWRCAADRCAYAGEHFTLPLPDGPGKALRLTIRPPRADLPIYLAAVGPRNLRLAGEVADGWLGIFVSPEHSGDLLRPGAGRAGRGRRGGSRATRWPGSTSWPRCPSSSPTTSRRPARRWPTTPRCTSAAWAAASRTSTTRWPAGWASRRPRTPSRTSTSTAARATRPTPCPST